jgi:hypothetical protein
MNNPPAFPNESNAGNIWNDKGMTLRDYFAAKAMQCITPILYESFDPGTVHERIAHDAYLFADAMLKAREA